MQGRQIVAITGATSGVGRATARRFAVQGAHIALLARGAAGLAATAREVSVLGGYPLAIPVDVADPEQVFAAALLIENDLGPIDVWINNATTTVYGRAEQLSADELRRITDVAFHGYVWGMRAALRGMRKRGRGTIVQVVSVHARRAAPLQAAHGAAEHAVRAYTDAVRSELIHDHCDVQLTTVHLPTINTPRLRWCENKLAVEAQPMPPIFQPELAAEAIHFAAHHRRRELWVGASTIRTILAHLLAPGRLDRRLARRVFGPTETALARPDRPSNLWQPVAGDLGAHGPFELRARRRDPIARASIWLGASGVRSVALAAGVVAVAATGLIGRLLIRRAWR